MELHRTLGSRLLASVYEAALVYDLREIGLEVKNQVKVSFICKN